MSKPEVNEALQNLDGSICHFALRASNACQLFDVSESTWIRWKDDGKIPAHVKIGQIVFWLVRDLERWCELKCPSRKEFERLTAER